MTPKTTLTLLLTLSVALASGAAQAAIGTAEAPRATASLDHVAQARALLDVIQDAPRTYEGALAISKAIATVTPHGWSEPVAANYGDFAHKALHLSGTELALEATRAQAQALGLDLAATTPAGHATPSAAVLAFLETRGAPALTDEQRAQVLALDALPSAQAAALARVVDAFSAMDAAAGAWLLSGDPAMRAGVFSARLALLESVAALEDATTDPTTMPTAGPGTFSLPPFLRVAVVPFDDVILENYILNVDLGGNDDYQNNAGGTWFGNCDLPAYAAASIDLGLGADAYNDGSYRLDSCGKNGGSMGGAGFLYDDGSALGWWGDRLGSSGLHNGINGGAAGAGAIGFAFAPGAVQVTAGSRGTNGGAADLGVGCLLATGDVRGDSWGTTGGASNGGYGMLVGPYSVDGGSYGTAGGAYGAGSVGFLASTGWVDGDYYGTAGGGAFGGAGTAVGGSSYSGGDYGTVGGGYSLGTGAVYGVGASYSGGDYGTVGGGADAGRGTIVDPIAATLDGGSIGTVGGAYGPGSSGFVWGGISFDGGSSGSVGGGANAGVGTVVAGGLGASGYGAGGTGVNGGGADTGVGHLIDPGVNGASYSASGGDGSNGGATRSGTGYLLDAAGNDRYSGGSDGANGGARSGAQGQLVDLQGDDAYSAGSGGVNGGAHSLSSVGILLDVSGNDSYTASCSGSNGGAWAGPANGLLFDGQGHDWYDDCVSTGWDQLVVTKGTVGAQIDILPL